MAHASKKNRIQLIQLNPNGQVTNVQTLSIQSF